ncbi:MAG: class I SAM-dependent methyltransferase [Candidatus Omnitrophica bacterium]|nr:class I SAM-dependent methyltransferase [Candidatus Omnitrophota bacterium]
MSSIFDRYYKKYDAWYDRNKFAYLSELKAIRKVLPKRGEGLEIGVGTGKFAAPLKITIGIDPSKNMIDIAQKRGVDAHLGTGERLPFRNAVFDYVAIIITICFVKDPQKVLKESRRVLKKNGKIIVGIIDKDNFLGKYYQKKKSIFYKQAKFFNVKEVRNLLNNAGFFKFSYYQTLYKLPSEINSIHKSHKGFGQGGFVVISGEKRWSYLSNCWRSHVIYAHCVFLLGYFLIPNLLKG